MISRILVFTLLKYHLSFHAPSPGGQQTWKHAVKIPKINILGFAEHIVCVTTSQICHQSRKSAIDNT